MAEQLGWPLRAQLQNRQPKGSAWIWGDKDELGRLNLLTPERIVAATKHVVSGQVIPLNIPFDQPSPPCFGREPFKHEIVRLDSHAFDETYTVNPQTASQWDGFRHFAHVPTGLFYNSTTAEDIQGPKASHKCGMQAWAQHGIVGRGLLLDFARYAEANGLKPTFYDNYKISMETLKDVAKSQDIDLRPKRYGGDVEVGDILLIRTGFLKHSRSCSEEVRAFHHLQPAVFGPGDGQRYIGLEQSEEMLDFLHDSYVSAVAADNPALEAWPSDKDYYLHEHLLALWGCPIGELWDLDRLAAVLAEQKRWTFLVSSSPNNVNGGIGSMSNTLAIL